MTDDFERRVRDRLRERAEPPVRDLAALTAYVAELPPRRRGRFFGRRSVSMSVVAGMAVVILVAAGLGLALSSRAPNVGPSPDSSVAPASSPSLALPTENITWTEVQLGAMLDGGYPSAVVPFGQGYVGVGQAPTPRPGAAVAWSSPDGRKWTRTATIADPLSYVSGVARSADGSTLVAIGYQAADRTMAWTSNDGVTWTAAELSAPTEGASFAALDVVAGEGGFLVLGHYQPDTGSPWPADLDPLTPLLWQSLDGRAWSSVEIPESGIQVATIAASGSGFLAGGARRDGSSWAPAIWSSADGRIWSPTTGLPVGGGVVDQYVVVNAIAAGPGLILAVSDRVDQMPGQVWSSTDGTTWQSIGERGTADPVARLLVWTRGGFILAGLAGDTPGEQALVVAVSADGTSWTRLFAQPAPTGESPGSVATDGSGTILISFLRSLLIGTVTQPAPWQPESSAPVSPTSLTLATSPPGSVSGDALGTGVLAGTVRNGRACLWLDPSATVRSSAPAALVWPFGFQVADEPLRIIGPDGQILAQVGDRVELGGGGAPVGYVPTAAQDPCELGRIFAVAQVASVNGIASNVGEGSVKLETRAPGALATCPAAAHEPLMLVMSNDHLMLRIVSSGRDIDASWPPGFSARAGNRITILDDKGLVVMTQGVERADVRGTLTQDGVIEVCGIGADTYQS